MDMVHLQLYCEYNRIVSNNVLYAYISNLLLLPKGNLHLSSIKINLFFLNCNFLLLLARHLSIITIWIKFLYHILRSDSKVRSYPFWKNKSFKPSQTLFDVQWCIYAKPLRPLNTFSQQQKWKYWICRRNIINEHWQQELQNETDRWTVAGR